jgi:hypothetical protein
LDGRKEQDRNFHNENSSELPVCLWYQTTSLSVVVCFSFGEKRKMVKFMDVVGPCLILMCTTFLSVAGVSMTIRFFKIYTRIRGNKITTEVRQHCYEERKEQKQEEDKKKEDKEVAGRLHWMHNDDQGKVFECIAVNVKQEPKCWDQKNSVCYVKGDPCTWMLESTFEKPSLICRFLGGVIALSIGIGAGFGILIWTTLLWGNAFSSNETVNVLVSWVIRLVFVSFSIWVGTYYLEPEEFVIVVEPRTYGLLVPEGTFGKELAFVTVDCPDCESSFNSKFVCLSNMLSSC